MVPFIFFTLIQLLCQDSARPPLDPLASRHAIPKASFLGASFGSSADGPVDGETNSGKTSHKSRSKDSKRGDGKGEGNMDSAGDDESERGRESGTATCGATPSSTTTRNTTATATPSSAKATTQPRPNERLVIQFGLESDCSPKDNYTVMVMKVSAIPCRSVPPTDNRCGPALEDSSVLCMTTPHVHGRIRNVQLKSTCKERIHSKSLNSTWPVDPSWTSTPPIFECPISVRDGEGDVELIIDSKPVAAGRFRLSANGTARWSDLQIAEADTI